LTIKNNYFKNDLTLAVNLLYIQYNIERD